MLKVAARVPPGAGRFALVLAARIAAVLSARHGSRCRHDRHRNQNKITFDANKSGGDEMLVVDREFLVLTLERPIAAPVQNANRLGGGVDGDWWSTFIAAWYLPAATTHHQLPQSLPCLCESIQESGRILNITGVAFTLRMIRMISFKNPTTPSQESGRSSSRAQKIISDEFPADIAKINESGVSEESPEDLNESRESIKESQAPQASATVLLLLTLISIKVNPVKSVLVNWWRRINSFAGSLIRCNSSYKSS